MLLLLLAAAVFAQYLARAGDRERAPARASLSEFPQSFDAWRQIDAQTLTAGELRELSPDDYLSRTYANDKGASIFLFIAYYASQRQRQTFHSPQNCLPGAGWTMSDHRIHQLDGGKSRINEYLIEKDGQKMVAFYWYHGRGRVEASEYWGRWQTIEDSIRRGRTDGALVRVIAPAARGAGAEGQAREAGLDFARKLSPRLSSYIPD
jgi:EpsI family protein